VTAIYSATRIAAIVSVAARHVGAALSLDRVELFMWIVYSKCESTQYSGHRVVQVLFDAQRRVKARRVGFLKAPRR